MGPWDACYDDLSVVPVGGMVGQPEGLEAFPSPALLDRAPYNGEDFTPKFLSVLSGHYNP